MVVELNYFDCLLVDLILGFELLLVLEEELGDLGGERGGLGGELSDLLVGGGGLDGEFLLEEGVLDELGGDGGFEGGYLFVGGGKLLG